MKHMLTIPLEFDTDLIEQRLQRDGYEDVLHELREKVEGELLSHLPGNSRSYYTSTRPKDFDEVNWGKFAGERIDAWLCEHSAEVVDEAALLLAQKGSRKAKWRDILAELKAQEDATDE